MTEIRLIAKRPSNLLSVALNQEITVEQLELVKLVIHSTDDIDQDQFRALCSAISESIYEVLGPRLDRLEGIEQYQVESR